MPVVHKSWPKCDGCGIEDTSLAQYDSYWWPSEDTKWGERDVLDEETGYSEGVLLCPSCFKSPTWTKHPESVPF